MSDYPSLESEIFDDGTDKWGYLQYAEAYRVGPVDLLIDELKLDLQTWKETAFTFEDFYRKTEAERDGLKDDLRVMTAARNSLRSQVNVLEVSEKELNQEANELQSELTKARELLTEVKAKGYFFSGEFMLRLEAALDHLSTPDAKGEPRNQCDGCQAGIPVESTQQGTPIHRMGRDGGYPDYMACTAKLYKED